MSLRIHHESLANMKPQCVCLERGGGGCACAIGTFGVMFVVLVTKHQLFRSENSNQRFETYVERPLYARAWGPLICDMQIMWLIENHKTVQVHFTQGQWKLKMMKSLYDIPHGSEWKVYCDLLDIALDPSKRVGPNTKVVTMSFSLIALGSLKYYIAMVGIRTQTHVASLNTINSLLPLNSTVPQLHNGISISHGMAFGWFPRAFRISRSWLLVHVLSGLKYIDYTILGVFGTNSWNAHYFAKS